MALAREVLTEVLAGLPTWNDRVQQSRRLMSWGFNAWQSKPLFKAGTNVGSAQVQMGSSSEVPLVAPRDLANALDDLDRTL